MYQKSNHFFLGGVYLGRSAPSPDLSGRSPPLVRTGLAMFPCFCVGVPFILDSFINDKFIIAFGSKLLTTNFQNDKLLEIPCNITGNPPGEYVWGNTLGKYYPPETSEPPE